ncbi:bifunctional isocitrate dehydrogenase kinase/phosphatase [Pseudomonadales bacterium]|nr:bifunctional isocitrate dehydrogenase kinase/phosphatase [Pseudomonadales bacterium]
MSLPDTIASTILNGFEAMFTDFMDVTNGAQARFEQAQWHEVHAAMRLRLTVYRERVSYAEQHCRDIAGDKLQDKQSWSQVKLRYAEMISGHPNHLIAESFFNSVFSRVFGHMAIRHSSVFAGVKALDPKAVAADDILINFEYDRGLKETTRAMLERFQFQIPYEDIDRDVDRIVHRVVEFFANVRPAEGSISIKVIENVFFRNKGAYLIGYIDLPDEIIPVALPFMLNKKGEVYVDAVILGSDEISMIFSFTRSYFMVNTQNPAQYVAVLKRMMPHKEIFELFTSIGFAKHGKTAFYQYAVSFTKQIPVEQKYTSAPGIKGMVMLVFTLPDFDYVYKVIKDRFTPPKDMTRKQVEEKYNMVKSSDRAGRMADVQGFKYLAFDKRRFSDELLEELYKEVPSMVQTSGNALILKHVYVERKMVPLNLYLPNADDGSTYSAIDEYGNAIKQLAAANIFPGDMLLKNFGVTRHGRVVFYDYDEICPLTDCNFRKIPEARTDEEEMAAGAWFDVKENDIFPEEFRLFFTGNPKAKRVFNQLHAEIYDYRFWQGLQNKIKEGYVTDVFPYRRQKRFKRIES